MEMFSCSTYQKSPCRTFEFESYLNTNKNSNLNLERNVLFICLVIVSYFSFEFLCKQMFFSFFKIEFYFFLVQILNIFPILCLQCFFSAEGNPETLFIDIRWEIKHVFQLFHNFYWKVVKYKYFFFLHSVYKS